jgi:hypothetical protein
MADKIPLKLNLGPNEIREFVAGDTVPEAHLPNTLVKLTGAQTLVDKTLDPTTVASRLLAVGATPARVLDLASTGGSTATNYDAVKLTTQAAGSGAIVSPVSSLPNANLKLQALGGSGNVLVRNQGVDMGTVVGTTGTQILSGKTLDTPSISNFSSATHNHTNTAGGGTLSAAALPADVLYGTNVINVANKTLLPTNKIQSTLLESTGTVPALSVGLTGAPSSLDFSCPKVVANVASSGAVLSVESSAANSNLILQGKGLGLVTTSNGEVVGISGIQTLTNKTLVSPTLQSTTLGPTTVIQSTLLESTGTVPGLSVGKQNLPTLVDYSCPKLISNVAAGGAILGVESSAVFSNLQLQGKGGGLVTTSNGTVVGTSGVQTLTNKTLTAPILSSPDIGDFTSAQHDHTSAAEGGGIDAAAISSGSFSQDRIAATGNRTGNYVDGLSSRILRSNGTASGSGGTAEWCERERVGQVKTETTQFYHPAINAYQTFSNFQFGGSWNTLPDVLKETGTSVLATNTGLKGKTLRVTGAATVTLNTATGSARSIDVQLNTAFGVVLFNASYIFGGTPAFLTNTNYVVFQIVATWRGDTSGGATWYTHAPIARVSDITTVARTEALMTANNAISALYTKALGASEFFYLQMKLNNTAVVGENIELTNCMWEVLN